MPKYPKVGKKMPRKSPEDEVKNKFWTVILYII